MINSFETLFEARERKFQQEKLFRGESVDLVAKITTDGVPDSLDGYTAEGYYQPIDYIGTDNETVFYSVPAEIADGKVIVHWTYDKDFGKAAYSIWALLTKSGEQSYPVCWRLALTHSPSYPPGETPEPIPQTLDFSKYTLLNAPWAEKEELSDFITKDQVDEISTVLSATISSYSSLSSYTDIVYIASLKQETKDYLSNMMPDAPWGDFQISIASEPEYETTDMYAGYIGTVDMFITKKFRNSFIFMAGMEGLITIEGWFPGQTVVQTVAERNVLTIGEASADVATKEQVKEGDDALIALISNLSSDLITDINAKYLLKTGGTLEFPFRLLNSNGKNLLSGLHQNIAIGLNSFADPVGSGNTNIAIGYNAKALSSNSTALGYAASAANQGATAIGCDASAVGWATALGRWAWADGENSLALGVRARSVGTDSIAIGGSFNNPSTSIANGDGSIQLGIGTNNNPNTFQVKNWTLLSSNGKIPVERIPYLSDYVEKTDKNLLPYATAATIALTLTQSVYKTTATGGVLPAITLTGIPTSNDYFCFEVEAAIPSGATLDPTAWASIVWLPGFELPQYDYAGKTLYISCRLDCQTRGVTASCWRVA